MISLRRHSGTSQAPSRFLSGAILIPLRRRPDSSQTPSRFLSGAIPFLSAAIPNPGDIPIPLMRHFDSSHAPFRLPTGAVSTPWRHFDSLLGPNRDSVQALLPSQAP